MTTKIVVEYWPIAKLAPYVRKLRKHDDAVQRMAMLVREYGFRIPILILGTGEIIDGHLRVKAAKLLELTELPVIVCDGWTEAQVKAFRLAVNRSASWAEFDLDLVGLEIGELKALNFDLSLTGFEEREISRLLIGEEREGGMELEPVDDPISRNGDLWICDNHRILCGDATSPLDVGALVGFAKPVLMVTDPPYGIFLDPMWRERANLGRLRQTGTVANDDRVDWSAAYRLFTGDVAYVWHAGVHAAEVARSLEATGFRIRSQIIWAKQHFALSRGDYHWQHEPCWYAVREGKSSNWSGDRKQSTLWEVANLNPFGGSREEEATGHGTQKPLELMRLPILNNTNSGEIVYDPFLGSGTTLIAAEQTGRFCYAIDIDPRYVDVAIRRWEKHSGKPAVLAGDGRTLDEISAERTRAAEV